MRCNNCNNMLPDDSNFCHYCGSKIERTERENPYRESPYADKQQTVHIPVPETSYAYTTAQTYLKKNTLLAKTILIILAIIIGIVIFDNLADDSDPGLEPVAEPRSGAILMGSEDLYGSKITIAASGGESCIVKLKTSSGITRLSFYVRAGDTVTVGVPSEYLYVYFASGDTWYGQNHLFGEDTSYSMDDTICNFTEYTWEYTLYPVSSGNFSQTPIDEDEF